MNKKLYWTEATVGDVLVMDIAQRQRIKLIDNYDGSTTRAIAVDPTTRYSDYYCSTLSNMFIQASSVSLVNDISKWKGSTMRLDSTVSLVV